MKQNRRNQVFFGLGTIGRDMFYTTVATYLILFGLGLRLLWDDWRYEVTSPGIGVPQWWYTLWLPLLALTIAARSVQRLVRQLRAS